MGKQEVQLIALTVNGTLCRRFQALKLYYFRPLYLELLLFFLIFSLLTRLYCPIRPCHLHLPQIITWKPEYFPPFFCFSCHLIYFFLYIHNMYRNSTQTNMFFLFMIFFHIRIQLFKWFLNSPHEPATYVHNDISSFFCCC